MNRQKEQNRVMTIVACLECDRRIALDASAKVHDLILCPSCDSEFEVVGLRPARIEWVYDDYDDEYDNYDDDDVLED